MSPVENGDQFSGDIIQYSFISVNPIHFPGTPALGRAMGRPIQNRISVRMFTKTSTRAVFPLLLAMALACWPARSFSQEPPSPKIVLKAPDKKIAQAFSGDIPQFYVEGWVCGVQDEVDQALSDLMGLKGIQFQISAWQKPLDEALDRATRDGAARGSAAKIMAENLVGLDDRLWSQTLATGSPGNVIHKMALSISQVEDVWKGYRNKPEAAFYKGPGKFLDPRKVEPALAAQTDGRELGVAEVYTLSGCMDQERIAILTQDLFASLDTAKNALDTLKKSLEAFEALPASPQPITK